MLALVLVTAAMVGQLGLGLMGHGLLSFFAAAPKPPSPLAETMPLMPPLDLPPPPTMPPPGKRHYPAGQLYPHWGEAGEAWHPAGPFMDFSYAGGGGP